MKFEKIASDPSSAARAGLFTTDHGSVETPIFMPVGTVGSVKGVYHRDLENDIRAQIILGNTYHLYLRPGLDTLYQAGGLHKFIGWDRPILTDSGGFQVFSLTGIRKLTPDGCTFSSHIDGSRHTFTPENNVDTQRKIGADIIMAFDECCPGDADEKYAAKSLKLTQSWLERYCRRFDETEPLYGYSQTMFPIPTCAARRSSMRLPWTTRTAAAMPSAAWPSASRRKKCMRCWNWSARCFPTASPVT